MYDEKNIIDYLRGSQMLSIVQEIPGWLIDAMMSIRGTEQRYFLVNKLLLIAFSQHTLVD